MSRRSITGLSLLAAVAIGGSVALLLSPGQVQVCHPNRKTCNTYTRVEYDQAKSDLATKWANKEELTWEEFQALVAIMDREAKTRGGMKLTNVEGRDGFRSKMSNFLTE